MAVVNDALKILVESLSHGGECLNRNMRQSSHDGLSTGDYGINLSNNSLASIIYA